MPEPPRTHSPEALAQTFRFFGEHECRDESPLYARLCLEIAEDEELLELAAAVRHWPVPNVLLGAVHFLLLDDPTHPLAAYYPSVSGAEPPGDDPYPLFRQFCFEQEEILRRLVSIRRTQTNEVGRCACFLPVFGLVAAREPEAPLALIEVGASAGLNLLWDYYRYDYGRGHLFGLEKSPVRIACEWRGPGAPPVPPRMPRIAYRLGLDLNPIDVTDPDEAQWLRALVWPEHRDRAAVLENAMKVAQRRPPPLGRGDALDLLPDALDAATRDATLCVFHSCTLNQLTPEDRQDFKDILAEHSYYQLVYRLSFEMHEARVATLGLHTYWQGQETKRVLGRCHPHGRWLEWME